MTGFWTEKALFGLTETEREWVWNAAQAFLDDEAATNERIGRWERCPDGTTLIQVTQHLLDRASMLVSVWKTART